MIAVIDSGICNLQSIFNALKLLGVDVVLTQKKEDVEKAKAVILPGVGAFQDGMKNLEKFGLIHTLQDAALSKKKPLLGICLGMQLLASQGTEHGAYPGLNIILGRTVRLQPRDPSFKIPHMGWNDVKVQQESILFRGIESPVCYFVHSYHVEPEDRSIITAVAEHGQEVTAAIQKDNIFGVQFHPEKSQGAGLKVLENFLSVCP